MSKEKIYPDSLYKEADLSATYIQTSRPGYSRGDDINLTMKLDKKKLLDLLKKSKANNKGEVTLTMAFMGGTEFL